MPSTLSVTVHGNEPENSELLNEEILQHLSMHGITPVILEYVRFMKCGDIHIKATTGMKVVISPLRNRDRVLFYNLTLC